MFLSALVATSGCLAFIGVGQMSDKHPGGRPLAFETVQELEEAIELYFETGVNP